MGEWQSASSTSPSRPMSFSENLSLGFVLWLLLLYGLLRCFSRELLMDLKETLRWESGLDLSQSLFPLSPDGVVVELL